MTQPNELTMRVRQAFANPGGAVPFVHGWRLRILGGDPGTEYSLTVVWLRQSLQLKYWKPRKRRT